MSKPCLIAAGTLALLAALGSPALAQRTDNSESRPGGVELKPATPPPVGASTVGPSMLYRKPSVTPPVLPTPASPAAATAAPPKPAVAPSPTPAADPKAGDAKAPDPKASDPKAGDGKDTKKKTRSLAPESARPPAAGAPAAAPAPMPGVPGGDERRPGGVERAPEQRQ